MLNNSICPGCTNRYHCTAIEEDVVCDDVTGCVIECDMYDYSEESEDFW